MKGSHLDRAERSTWPNAVVEAVFFGRFTAALRVMIPGLAGMAGLRYRTFVTYNVASGVGWVTLSVMLGYLGGSSWRHVEHVASSIGLAALAALVLAALGGYLLRHTKPPRLRRLTTRLRASRSAARLQALFPRATAWGPPRPHQEHLRSDPMTTPDPADTRPSPRFGPRGTVVIIPTYNEAGNVSTVIDRVRAAAPDVDVLVVDDNSPDGTAALVKHHPGFLPTTPAVGKDWTGCSCFAARQGRPGGGLPGRLRLGTRTTATPPWCRWTPTSRTHPSASRRCWHALADHDVAVGSRYVPGGAVRDWPLSRRVISRGGNLYVRLVLGLTVHDATAGFKAFRADALERIGAARARSPTATASRSRTPGARSARDCGSPRCPITFTDRPRGDSKMSRTIVAEALTRVLRWRWSELLHRAGLVIPHDGRSIAAPPRTPPVPPPPDGRACRALHQPAPTAVIGAEHLACLPDPRGADVPRGRWHRVRRRRRRVQPSALDAPVREPRPVGGTYPRGGGRHVRHLRREPQPDLARPHLGEPATRGESLRALQHRRVRVLHVTLVLSHDVLGLTSRLADNTSANVVGLALGTVFRFVTYRRFVFAPPKPRGRPGPHRPARPRGTPCARGIRNAAATYADRMHVVVVDDEHRMVELISSYLDDQGVSTVGCLDGPSGLAAARRLDLEAVVLDLMLPGLSGIEVCRQLRREGNDVPILMLTARGAVPERVAGLEAGADDYLVKPFALEELHARLRAIRRRLDPDTNHRLVVGDITLDPLEQRVWVADTEVTLSRREFAMLTSLMESRGRVVSRLRLYDDVWEGEVDIRSNALDVHMSRVRNHLRASSNVTITTLRALGYRLDIHP